MFSWNSTWLISINGCATQLHLYIPLVYGQGIQKVRVSLLLQQCLDSPVQFFCFVGILSSVHLRLSKYSSFILSVKIKPNETSLFSVKLDVPINPAMNDLSASKAYLASRDRCLMLPASNVRSKDVWNLMNATLFSSGFEYQYSLFSNAKVSWIACFEGLIMISPIKYSPGMNSKVLDYTCYFNISALFSSFSSLRSISSLLKGFTECT